MSRDSLGFGLTLASVLAPVMKSVDRMLQGFSQEALKNIVLCLVAGLFALVLRQTEPKRELIKVGVISYPPWLPLAICCLMATLLLMQI